MMDDQDVTEGWGIMAVNTGEKTGRGDLAAAKLHTLLRSGWEPFAVSDGQIWLRKPPPFPPRDSADP